MSIAGSTAPSAVRITRFSLLPYLVVGAIWFAFLMVAFRVRTIEPIFRWVFAHGLILDNLGLVGFWKSSLGVLAAYMAAAVLGWIVVEIGGRDPRHVWRRAVLVWIGLQTIFCLVAAFLIQTGVVAE